MSFTLNEELTVIEGIEDKTVSAPREHPFTMQSVGGQTLAVFTETSSGEFLFPSSNCLFAERGACDRPQIVLFVLEPRSKCFVVRWWRCTSCCSLYILLSSCTVFFCLPCLCLCVVNSQQNVSLSTFLTEYIYKKKTCSEWIREHSMENRKEFVYWKFVFIESDLFFQALYIRGF